MKGKQKQYLFQERLKNPYFGFWGLATGKMRWGETVEETAARELDEETGLTADWRVAGVYHEHVSLKNTTKILEDKIFFVVQGTNPKGKLITDFEGGHNEWLTRTQAMAKEKTFTSFATELDIVSSNTWLHEVRVEYDKDLF